MNDVLDREILMRYRRLRPNTVLVEGFEPKEYIDAVERFRTYIAGGTAVSFADLMGFDFISMSRLGTGEIFVYDVDLFGNKTNPKAATSTMVLMRSFREVPNRAQSHLMFARPGADLDYDTVPGYTFNSNHPLGNWCEFYLIKNLLRTEDL